MYEPALHYERTDNERANLTASWDRSDRAFFAAGACHILAYNMKSLYPNRNLQIVYIYPLHKKGSHVYVIDGDWAFDFNGWTLESGLLAETARAYRAIYPSWDYRRIMITSDLETFCKEYYHRPPDKYAHDPTRRALDYLSQFPSTPC
jgi:hypothetical protein